ncbi:hypothetical protein EVAR_44953_1 [Eumeta japonica]|uniref:Uncharacterized protein n=1 Tax=Eumeta variegata TaxID=151549 RepID=A0A4C1W6G7_EUMVA|nr:hypothetical protein EVAR_44953_1 [Eumeta japonica]
MPFAGGEKMQNRKEQLIKWKQERQRKKQITAQQRKKPFVVGIVHQPLNFIRPLSVPRCVPNTTERVTGSQTTETNILEQKELKERLFDEKENLESVHHFRQQLNSKSIRMTKLCETWDHVFGKEQLPVQQTSNNLPLINNAIPAENILKSKNVKMFKRKLTQTILFDKHGLDSNIMHNSSLENDKKVYIADSKTAYKQINKNINMRCRNKTTSKEIIESIRIDSNLVEGASKHYKDTMVKNNKKKTLRRQEAFDEENADIKKKDSTKMA